MSTADGSRGIELPGLPELAPQLLVNFLQKQRWFSGKARTIGNLRLRGAVPLVGGRTQAVLALVEVDYSEGNRETYFLPLAVTAGEAGKSLVAQSPDLVVAQLQTAGGSSVLHDGLIDDGVCRRLLELIATEESVVSQAGAAGSGEARSAGYVRGTRTSLFEELRGSPAEIEPIQTAGQDQSNSAVVFGNRLFLKVFRKVETGLNPDFEITRYLTERSSFSRLPRLAGAIEAFPAGGVHLTLATLQELVPNDGNAWQAMLADVAGALGHARPQAARGAELLGERTAEMHLALAQKTEADAFGAVPLTREDCRELASRLRRGASAAFSALEQKGRSLEPVIAEQVKKLLQAGPAFVERFANLLQQDPGAMKTRIHGDYHLGQVLCQGDDFIILDFEGEPARPLAERRAKDSPLRDVAGMLRSFGYAAYAGLFAASEERPEEFTRLEPHAIAWQEQTSAAYLRGYFAKAAEVPFLPSDESQLKLLLDFFVIEKAFYEVLYELNNRPTWLRIPLAGILSIAARPN